MIFDIKRPVQAYYVVKTKNIDKEKREEILNAVINVKFVINF